MSVDINNAAFQDALNLIQYTRQSVFLTGKAGTGKTLLALAAALEQSSDYKQILLARPIVALANKDLGFLPGDENSTTSGRYFR